MLLKNKYNGATAEAFQGFSWTTLFFACWPALFRGDYVWFSIGFVVCVGGGFFTAGLISLIYCVLMGFCYNDIHLRGLREKGYE